MVMHVKLIVILLQDSRLAVEKYKSGFSPPGNIIFRTFSGSSDIQMNHKSGDIPFEDLSTVETVKDSSLASTPSEKKTSIMGTISGTWFD